jgi:hypothetical protein
VALKNRLKTNQGQALIESLLVSAVVGAILSVLGAIVYFSLVHAGVNYLLHEYLICKGTQGAKDCRGDFQQRIPAFLFAAKLTSFESTQHYNKQKVRVTLGMPMNRRLTIKKELELYR